MPAEPYWVRYHREKQVHEAAIRTARNPPPPKSTKIVPMLVWDRTIAWWPKHDWERYDKISNDFSPAHDGYRLREIRDVANHGEDAEGFPVARIEVSYSPYICEECPEQCWYMITSGDGDDEEFLCEDGFKSIDEARVAASQALAALLVKKS